MAYSRLLSLRGDRRETANDDSRRSRPAVDRLCRPKGGMNDQRFCDIRRTDEGSMIVIVAC